MTATYTYVICNHPPDRVTADILAGSLRNEDGVYKQVQWCQVCGAYRLVFGNPHDGSDVRVGDWHEPELRKITGDDVRTR